MEKGSFKWMKSLNRSIVLNIIRTQGPISRAKIARVSKLTPPTVSSLVNELLESELVIESEQGKSLGGRKPTMLIINSNRFYIIGVDIGPKKIRAALTDLSGDLVEAVGNTISNKINENELVILLKKSISKLIESHQNKEIIGIGVGMHGVVDVATGTSVFAPNLNLRNIPLKEELEKEYNVLVKVDNDVRAMAFGEYWYSDVETSKNMVTVNIGHGVGAGIVLNGELFHGDHFLAGEIGHMTIDVAGRKCTCGNTGCWQTLVSGPAIAEIAKEKSVQHPETDILSLVNGDVDKINGETVYSAATNGDALAIEILQEAGDVIGIGLTNLIHMLNPEKIIIGGGVAKASEFILPRVKDTIAKRGITNQAKSTLISCSKQGKNATAMGAAALVLGEIFEGSTPIVE